MDVMIGAEYQTCKNDCTVRSTSAALICTLPTFSIRNIGPPLAPSSSCNSSPRPPYIVAIQFMTNTEKVLKDRAWLESSSICRGYCSLICFGVHKCFLAIFCILLDAPFLRFSMHRRDLLASTTQKQPDQGRKSAHGKLNFMEEQQPYVGEVRGLDPTK